VEADQHICDVVRPAQVEDESINRQKNIW